MLLRRAAAGPLRPLDIGMGPPLVLLQGFALAPRTYLDVALLLAERWRVLVPALFAGSSPWTPETALADVAALLDERGIGQATLLGHSFGGAVELNFAIHYPERITELVFVDTLAMSHEWTLAAEAMHPVHLLWMATPRAAVDFAYSFATHPLQLVRAAWWGFTSDRSEQVPAVARLGIPAHVLWADRDSLLARSDGEAFARDLGASFTVVHGAHPGPTDHDWIYRHPKLLVSELAKLDLRALAGDGEDSVTGLGTTGSSRDQPPVTG